MITFFTPSVYHLTAKLTFTQGRCVIKHFSDGELYVKVEEDVADKDVWIVTSTQPPAENILTLFFLLDALTACHVKKVNLFFIYFAYARQSIALEGEARSAGFIAEILKRFPLNKIYILHAHAPYILQEFLSFNTLIPFDFFCFAAHEYDVIAAPDKGAFELAREIAQQCNKEAVFLQKTRPKHEEVTITSVNGTVAGKKVLLVDDIISTGRTLIESVRALVNLGAQEVAAAATHGIFAHDAYERLEQSMLKKIYVTNTFNISSVDKVTVYDISPYLESFFMKIL
jgi:ribose-phosphate pyrophosphokinase